MERKVVLITGATDGLGKAAALALAKQGATVVIVGRDPAKTRATAGEIKEQSGTPSADGLVADLSSMAEVRRLANELRQGYSRLDVLINNAGAIFARRQATVDGYERTFALNHLSQFLLTNLLLSMLEAGAPSRIINVSSQAHEGGAIDFDDLQGERSYGIGGGRAYSRSKLANIMFTYELARRLAGAGVTANALHPGTVATRFGEDNGGMMRLGMRMFHRFAISAEEGADTIIYLASSPEVEGVTGRYWEKRRPIRSSPASYDEGAQKRLWDVSAQMTGLVASARA